MDFPTIHLLFIPFLSSPICTGLFLHPQLKPHPLSPIVPFIAPLLTIPILGKPVEINVEGSPKAKVDLPCDPVTPLLGRCIKDLTFCSADACSAISTAALLTIAGEWEQPKCPSVGTDKEGVHTHKGLLVHCKEERNLQVNTWN